MAQYKGPGAGQIEVRVNPNPSCRQFDFYLVNEKTHEVATLKMEGYDKQAIAPVAFSLPVELAQALLDDLWRSGLRPTHEEGAAGALKATERHLEDMRRIAFSYIELDKEVPHGSDR